MANKDLRDWIRDIENAGELKTVKGAEPNEEIGGFVDIYQRKMGNPALIFDDIPGFPKGHRVVANILTSVPRINIALGLPAQASEMELIQWWRSYMRNAPSHAPKAVNGGRAFGQTNQLATSRLLQSSSRRRQAGRAVSPQCE